VGELPEHRQLPVQQGQRLLDVGVGHPAPRLRYQQVTPRLVGAASRNQEELPAISPLPAVAFPEGLAAIDDAASSICRASLGLRRRMRSTTARRLVMSVSRSAGTVSDTDSDADTVTDSGSDTVTDSGSDAVTDSVTHSESESVTDSGLVPGCRVGAFAPSLRDVA
jgi:hypothetical protein